MIKTEKLSASLQDYIEAIFWIVADKGAARTRDIAKKLGVKAGSVTGALQSLSQKRFIDYTPYEVITLTSSGLEEARRIIRKHEVLRNFFVQILGVKPALAEDNACRIEHMIDDELIERLINFSEFIQSCPRCGDNWLNLYKKRKGIVPKASKQCKSCLIENMEKYVQGKKQMNEVNKNLTLIDIPKGSRCVVKAIKKKGVISKRLAEMGVGKGSVIEVERVAPLGDPVEIKVKGYHLSIRKIEAESIEVGKE